MWLALTLATTPSSYTPLPAPVPHPSLECTSRSPPLPAGLPAAVRLLHAAQRHAARRSAASVAHRGRPRRRRGGAAGRQRGGPARVHGGGRAHTHGASRAGWGAVTPHDSRDWGLGSSSRGQDAPHASHCFALHTHCPVGVAYKLHVVVRLRLGLRVLPPCSRDSPTPCTVSRVPPCSRTTWWTTSPPSAKTRKRSSSTSTPAHVSLSDRWPAMRCITPNAHSARPQRVLLGCISSTLLQPPP